MFTEKDLAKGPNGAIDSDEDNQEKSVQWLLEMDLSEPEEKLFTVSGNEYSDTGLSASEAEIAGRPLVRGNDKGDDLANYVDEEIVISSEHVSDIYAPRDDVADGASDSHREEPMAIDFSSRERDVSATAFTSSVDEGTDILGLATEDDIGEKFRSIQRVKRTPTKSAAVKEGGKESSQDIAAQEAPEELTLEKMDDGIEDAADGSSHDFEVAAEHITPEPSLLTEAPVPSQVADPDSDVVANDSGLDGAFEQGSVLDYVASIPQPEDDEEFDNYLLGGEHLLEDSSDPEELTIELFEGDAAVDPTADIAIDYHDDFGTLDGFAERTATAIAPVIDPIMEEISSAVQARLESLGLSKDAVTVDVRLGSDEESIKQCYADGFEPAHAICFDLPKPLLSLEQEARDAIYVRLLNTESNKSWNDLFSADFVAFKSGQDAPADVSSETVVDELQGLDSADAGFGEDIFGDDFADEFSAQLQAEEGSEIQDIEEAFSNLSQPDEGEDDLCIAGFDASVDEAVVQTVVQESVQSKEQLLEEDSSEIVVEEVFAESIPEENTSEIVVEGISAEPTLENNFSEPAADDERLAPAMRTVEEEPIEDKSGAASEEDNKLAAFDGTCTDGFVPEYIDFSFTSQSNAEIFADFLDAFIEEGSEEVEKLEREVGEWEKEVTSEPLFANACRTLHTIKGIAKGVGLHRMGTLVHNFETLLEKMPRPAQGEEQNYFRIVNAWLDAVVRGVEFVTDQRADIASELPVQAEKAEAIQEPQADSKAKPKSKAKSKIEAKPKGKANSKPETKSKAAAENSAKADSAKSDNAKEKIAASVTQSKETSALEKKRDKQLADEGAKVLAAQQSVRITSEKLDHLLNLTSQAQQLGVRASQNTSRGKRSSAELQARLSSVRTHIRKIADRALLNVNAQPGKSTPDLDALEMDQYSELQEAASILREGVEDLADLVDVLSRQNAHVEALLKQQSSVISSISSSIQGARVVPVSRLMPGLRRIVRTVSTDLGKVVSFQVLNETGALDRDHYARLQTIMEHMVRNALDHGIESPEQRVAEGKPTGGRITIDVRKSGGDYVVRLSDDGKGIDPDAIRQSAYEKELDVDVDALSDEEATRLIFHKGFSTASTLSEVSGRGVGMDIVMTELQQMGGDVQIQSAIGLGTAFEVRIPSNVSVNGALLVAAAGESYAIPLNGLIAVEQVPVDDFFAAVEQHTELSVSDVKCEPAYLATLCQGVPLPDRSAWNKYVPVIVAGSEDRHMAIAIDNLEEALELVVRSLGSQFSTVPGVAGAATTAEGEAIVALDLNLLVKSAGDDASVPVAESQAQAATLLALVVDDSRTQRMVATSQLDAVGVETVTAENGLVAIDLLNATHRLPDVILLDVEMPVKDGIQTLREIRKSSRYGNLPVIMVTSRTGAKHRALASEAGCNAYMGKPFNFAALIKQINELTGHDLQLS